MSVYLLNALPINAVEKPLILDVTPVSWLLFCEELKKSIFASYIGHESTAKALSMMCGIDIKVNRGMVEKFEHGDVIYVAVLSRRLGEGEIINNPTDVIRLFRFYRVEVVDPVKVRVVRCP